MTNFIYLLRGQTISIQQEIPVPLTSTSTFSNIDATTVRSTQTAKNKMDRGNDI